MITRRSFFKTISLIAGGIVLGLNPFKRKALSKIRKTYFVDSKYGKDRKGYGLSVGKPFKTPNYALKQCISMQKDMIFILPDYNN